MWVVAEWLAQYTAVLANFKVERLPTILYIASIRGYGGGRQEGGRKWAKRGGIRIFPAGGEALFAPGGEGY